jgi:hypothetical protein
MAFQKSRILEFFPQECSQSAARVQQEFNQSSAREPLSGELAKPANAWVDREGKPVKNIR